MSPFRIPAFLLVIGSIGLFFVGEWDKSALALILSYVASIRADLADIRELVA